jgi:hypothetical protein
MLETARVINSGFFSRGVSFFPRSVAFAYAAFQF